MTTAANGETHHITIDDAADAGSRLDKVLAANLPDLSRTRVQALLDEGRIHYADGTPVRSASLKVKQGEAFTVTVPPIVTSEIRAVEMPLDIVYEDDDILIINKPAGLTVHPAPDITTIRWLTPCSPIAKTRFRALAGWRARHRPPYRQRHQRLAGGRQA